MQWTLRFKQHKTTVLLFVEPGQSFDSIKQDLLDALKKIGRTDINGVSVPSDASNIILGLPVDKNDFSKGWVRLEILEMEAEDGVNGKKKVGGKKSVLNASPQGAGLKDGAVLAFRFSESVNEDADGGLDDDVGKWNVMIPSYEDEYGSQAEGQGTQ